MKDCKNQKIDYLTILSMTRDELDHLIFIEQLRNPVLEMTEYRFADFLRGRDPGALRRELLSREAGDPLAGEILRDFFTEILEGRISDVSRSLKVPTNRVKEAVAEILSDIQYLPPAGEPDPDIEAVPEGDGWSIRVFPEEGALRLNEAYIQMEKETGGLNMPEDFPQAVRRAKQFLSAMQQRSDILHEMMRRLMESQREFAMHGGNPVRVFGKNIAELLGVYPTVLRFAAEGKYVRVPFGMVPLVRFFGDKGEAEIGNGGGAQFLKRTGNDGRNAEEPDPGKEEAAALPCRVFRDPDEVDHVAEICLLAPTMEMALRAEEICRIYGKQIDVFISELDTAADIAEKLEKKGAQIFISRQGTKRRIEEKSSRPVVNVYMDIADYVEILEHAARVKGIIAFFSYGIVQEDIRSMCQLMRLNVRFYSFYNLEDCIRSVRQAIADGAVLGVGGATSSKAAARIGLPHITVENSRLSLLKAIEAAEQILDLRKKEAAKQADLALKLERFNLALNFTHDAVIAVDRDGTIDVMNHEAEKLVGVSREEAVGRRIEKVIPDTRVLPVLETGRKQLNNVLKHGSSLWSSNIVPIMIDGSIRGAVTTFQDVRSLQDDEKRIRIKLAEKGLVAKYRFSDIWGRTPGIRNAVRAAEKFARADSTVLINGETGTGKELFAQSIHNASRRADGPFVAVNCGSLPRDILEAELFGYVEGAFTGASRGGKTGLFEMAHEGTIFLDEIGEMPLETQVHLLRVLQEKEIRRIGSDRVTPVDIRVIAATNRDLPKEIAAGRFRRDLYYRLNVLNIAIPPLRERREDIGLILLKFLGSYMPAGSEEETLVREILKRRTRYSWPGNVRELENLAERIFVLLSQGEDAGFILEMLGTGFEEEKDAGIAEDAAAPGEAPLPPEGRQDLFMSREEEFFPEADGPRELLLRTLRKNGFEIGRTADALGINRSTLWRRMKKYGICRNGR